MYDVPVCDVDERETVCLS